MAGVMDDTAEKTLSMVSKAADEEFSMEFFKDAVRYLSVTVERCCVRLK